MVRNEHEDSEALAELRFPSDVSEHVGFFAGQVRCVLYILILFPPPSPFLSLSLSGSHLCAFSLEPIISLFGKLGVSPRTTIRYSKWDRFLSPVFPEFFLELHIVRGIEMLLPSLCKPSSLPLELCEAVCFSSVVAHVSSLGSVACSLF